MYLFDSGIAAFMRNNQTWNIILEQKKKNKWLKDQSNIKKMRIHTHQTTEQVIRRKRNETETPHKPINISQTISFRNKHGKKMNIPYKRCDSLVCFSFFFIFIFTFVYSWYFNAVY